MNFSKMLVLSALVLALCPIQSRSQNEFQAPVPGRIAEPEQPFRYINVDIKSYTAPDTVDGQSAAYYQQMGGGVIWLPDMSVSGLLMFYNQSHADDYIAFSAKDKIDLRDRIKVVGAMLGNRYLPAKDLPPVKLSFIGDRGVPKEFTDDIILKPALAVDGYAAKGINVFFEFPSKEYVWEPGLYDLTFEIDLYPGEQKPRLVQTSFNVKKIEKEDDRLNVLWFQYKTAWRLDILGGITEQEFREAVKLLETIIAKRPNNAALQMEYVKQLESLGEWHEAIAAMTAIIALVESNKSSTNVEIREVKSQSELLKYLKSDLSTLTYYVSRMDEVKAINEKSSAAEKKKIIKALIYPVGSAIPPLALDKVQELKMMEAVPAILEALMSNDFIWLVYREQAWKILMELRPEAAQVQYDPYATQEERKAVVAQLKVLLKMPD